MIKIYHRTLKDKEPKVLETLKTGVWVHVENPSDEEIKRLAEELNLDEGLLRDATDPYEVPRLEREDGIVYIYTRVPFQEGNRVATAPLLIALTNGALITVCDRVLPIFDKFSDGRVKFTTTQKTKLFLQLFNEINNSYNSFLTTMSRRVRSTSVQIESITNKTIVQFVLFENILNDFLAALVPTNALLNTLLSGKTLKLYEEDHDLVEDIFLTNGQLIELGKANLKTIVNIREAYSTIMSNNLNQVVKLLTSLTILMTVPMIISSFYGMNVALPFAESPLAFFAILTATLMVTLVILFAFIRNRWL